MKMTDHVMYAEEYPLVGSTRQVQYRVSGFQASPPPPPPQPVSGGMIVPPIRMPMKDC